MKPFEQTTAAGRAVAFGLALALAACGGDAPTEEPASATATPPAENDTTEETTLVLQENIDALANRIVLPVRPDRVAWLDVPLGNPDNRVPGPTDHRLDAVLTYSSAGAGELLELVAGAKDGQPRSLAVEEWYPEEILAHATDGRIAVVEHDATPFLAAPFTQGTISRVGETEHFLLTLLSF